MIKIPIAALINQGLERETTKGLQEEETTAQYLVKKEIAPIPTREYTLHQIMLIELRSNQLRLDLSLSQESLYNRQGFPQLAIHLFLIKPQHWLEQFPLSWEVKWYQEKLKIQLMQAKLSIDLFQPGYILRINTLRFKLEAPRFPTPRPTLTCQSDTLKASTSTSKNKTRSMDRTTTSTGRATKSMGTETR